MTDKELIKQEIERRIEQCYRTLSQDLLERERNETNCCLQQYKEILQFIDSLPEEPSIKGITWEDVNTLESLIYQVHNEYPSIGEKSFGLEVLERFQDCQDDIEEPVNEDLEEEIKNYFSTWLIDLNNHKEFLLQFARHFAKWGRNHFEDKSEMVSEDLEEEIDRYYSDWQFDDDTIYEDMRDICRHFAEWQKKKDQETIELAEDHAMLAGMNKMKEEMMKDAVYGYVSLCHDYPHGRSLIAVADGLENFEYAEKIKIIICKTEQQ